MFLVLSPAFALEGLSGVGEAGKSVTKEYRAASVRAMKVGDPQHRPGGDRQRSCGPKRTDSNMQYNVHHHSPISSDCHPRSIARYRSLGCQQLVVKDATRPSQGESSAVPGASS